MKVEIKSINRISDPINILVGMAMSPRFLEEIYPHIKPNYWENDWEKILCGIIYNHTSKYKKAAITVLTSITDEYSDYVAEEDTADGVIALSERITELYENYKDTTFSDDNYDILIDGAYRWLNENNLKDSIAKASEAFQNGDYNTAEKAISNYRSCERIIANTIDLNKDTDAYFDALNPDSDKKLFIYPGALGTALGTLSRNELLMILGETGAGKSQIAHAIAQYALLRGFNVLKFNLENSEETELERHLCSLSFRPSRKQKVRIPYFEYSEEDSVDDDNEVDEDDAEEGAISPNNRRYNIKYINKVLEPPKFDRAEINKNLKRIRMVSNGGSFFLSTWGPHELTPGKIEETLETLEKTDGFIPDIILVDPSEFMQLSKGDTTQEKLEYNNLELKRIGKQWDALMVLPIQSNRSGYGKKMKKDSVGGNIGYVKDATYVIGFSRTDEDKENDTLSINILKNRNKSEASPIIGLSCFAINRPLLDTRYKYQVLNYGDTDDDETI